MKTLTVSYLTALAVLVVLDALWLGVISRDFYKSRLGDLLLDRPIWSAAILFYLIHAAGIAVFAAPLAMSTGTWTAAALYGGFFGLCVYGAYDLTNLATLRGWPVSLTVVDLAWGVVVSAVTTLVVFAVVKKLA